MQRAVQASLDAQVDVAWYQRQRDRVAQGLASMGYSLVHPRGAFYAFPASPIPDDVAFTQELLQHRVLVTPGTGFGGPGHFRISYSVQERVLEGALEGAEQGGAGTWPTGIKEQGSLRKAPLLCAHLTPE